MELSREQDHRCQFCDFKCATRSKLEVHMRIHTREKPFLCGQCSQGFSLTSTLNLHVQTVHKGIRRVYEKKYKCPLCPYETISRQPLEDHIRRHTGERSFPCQHPNYKYAGKSPMDIRMHNTNKHTTTRNFVCSFPNCGHRGKNAQNMRRHILSHSEDRPFICDVDGCSYKAKRSDRLKIHQRRVHHGQYKPFACYKCDYSATSREYLRVHETTHAEEKSLKCDFSGCTYACKSQRNLRRHIVSRHKERTLTCDFAGCSATATSRSNLRMHKKNAHSERVYKCPSCNYQAYYQSQLKIHIASHNTSNKIPCPTNGCTFRAKHQLSLNLHMRYHKANLGCPVDGCGKVSTSTSAWKRHMKTHDPTGRPFHCPICPKHYARSYGLSRHLPTHTHEKPIKCPLCDFGATTNRSITAHVHSMHSKVLPQFVFDEESICDHCNVNFGCAVGLAIHRMKLKTAVIMLTRMQLVV